MRPYHLFNPHFEETREVHLDPLPPLQKVSAQPLGHVTPLHKTICMFTSTTHKDSPQHMSVCAISFEVRTAMQISKHGGKL